MYLFIFALALDDLFSNYEPIKSKANFSSKTNLKNQSSSAVQCTATLHCFSASREPDNFYLGHIINENHI